MTTFDEKAVDIQQKIDPLFMVGEIDGNRLAYMLGKKVDGNEPELFGVIVAGLIRQAKGCFAWDDEQLVSCLTAFTQAIANPPATETISRSNIEFR